MNKENNIENTNSYYTTNSYENDIKKFEQKHGKDVAFIINKKRVLKPKGKKLITTNHRFVCNKCKRYYYTLLRPVLCGCGCKKFTMRKNEVKK